MNENFNADIELRSEKVRNMIGLIPSNIERIGISVISTVIGLILFLAYIIPYPQYKTVPVKLYMAKATSDSIPSVYGISYLSGKEIKGIKTGQEVKFEADGQLLKGFVSQIVPVIETNGSIKKSNYQIKIYFKTPVESGILDLTLNGKILVSNQPFLKKIL